MYYFGKNFDENKCFTNKLVKSYEECLNLAINESINILK